MTVNDEPEWPEMSQPIWRYLDLAKFVSLLQTSALYFSTLARLKTIDPMEGLFLKEFFTDKVHEEAANLEQPPPTSEYLAMRLKMMSEVLDRDQHHYLINCWHLSPDESQAMWRLYGGVAIRSSAQRLWDCFGFGVGAIPRVALAKVNYIQYKPGVAKWSRPEIAIYHKDISLVHEQEVRFIWYSMVPLSEGGLTMAADRKTLIESVYISPYAEKWLAGVVKGLLEKYGLPDIQVIPSRLTNPPASL